jgi:hypothetical protein
MPLPVAAPALDRKAVLVQCRVLTERRLTTALGPLLDAMAKQLAEAGAQGKDREDREQCLAAAHRLFHEREDFLAGFRAELAVRFEARSASLLAGGPSAEELDRETLAMLKTNVLENEVAVIKLSVLLKSRAAAELDELARRVCALLARPALEDGHNPIGPMAIAHAVYAGLAKCRVESKAQRAIRPALEAGLTAPVRELYAAVNQLMEKLRVPAVVPAAVVASAGPATLEPLPDTEFASMAAPGAASPSASLPHETVLPAAEVAAARAVASALVGAQLPPPVDELLRNEMRELLARAHSRHGSTSPAWQQAVRMMLDLVWSLKPKDAADRAKLAAMLPALLPRVSATLGAMDLAPARRREVLDALAQRHRELMRGAS